MNWNPIAKRLWGDDIALGDLRMKLCKEYFESLPPELLNPKYVMETKDYTPAKTFTQLLARLRKYDVDGWSDKEEDKLNNRDKECLRKTIQYCHIYRFILEMNSLVKSEERKLCEAQFLKLVIDKPDMNPEDLDLYINLVLSVLDTRRMREEFSKLIEIRDDELEQSQANGKASVNLALMQGINELRKEISSREAKQENTINKLTGERKERLKNGAGTNFNISNIIEIFREKDKRDKNSKTSRRAQEKIG